MVSVHRKYNDTDSHAALLARGGATLRPRAVARRSGRRQLVLQAPPSVSPPVAAGRRRATPARSGRPSAPAGSTRWRRRRCGPPPRIAGEAHEVDLDTPPWKKGRAGTSVGRAVHATLQTVDLATGDDVDAIARPRPRPRASTAGPRTSSALARAALGRAPRCATPSPAGATGASCTSRAAIGDTLIEGFIDLLYESADGLVVVDYKTDTVRSPADVDAAVARYRLQGATYAVALEQHCSGPSPPSASFSPAAGSPSSATSPTSGRQGRGFRGDSLDGRGRTPSWAVSAPSLASATRAA